MCMQAKHLIKETDDKGDRKLFVSKLDTHI